MQLIWDYDLTSSFEADGEWTLPWDASRRVPGRLIFRAGEFIELWLWTKFPTPNLDGNHDPFLTGVSKGEDIEVISGTMSNGIGCTLFKNDMVSNRTSFDSTVDGEPMTKLVFRSEWLVVGRVSEAAEDLGYLNIGFSFDDLTNWLGDQWLQYMRVENSGYNLQYSFPEARIYELPVRSGSVKIEYDHTIIEFYESNNSHVRYDLFVNFIPDEPLAFDAYLRFIRDFQNLLILFYGVVVPLTIVEGRRTGGWTGQEHVSRILFPTGPQSLPPEYLWEYALPFSKLANGFDEILCRWFQMVDSLGPTMDLLFSHLGRPDQFPNARFLALTQALESFHRAARATPGTRYTLRQRLITLLDELSDDERVLVTPQSERFLDDVIATRNYLTHYAPDLESKSMSDADMRATSAGLVTWLCILLFHELDLDKEIVVEAVNRMALRKE